MRGRTGVLLAVFLASASIAASGTTIRVPLDQPTIEAGLAAATGGDTVMVACGTYNEYDLQLTPGVCLRSETGLPDCVTIDAQGQGRVIGCTDAGEGTVMEGFTITNGHISTRGGALVLMNAPIRVAQCVFRGNHSEHGGACHVAWSDASFENCSFQENAADVPGPNNYFAGGALYCYDCSPEFDCCDFLSNSGHPDTKGGAVFIYGEGAAPRFGHCRFEDNHVGGFTGGAMAVYAGAAPAIHDCVFRGNQGGNGGAVFIGTPALTIERTLFDENSAARGGGVYFGWGGGAGSLSMCTFVNNAAGEGGGVFFDETAGASSIAATIIAFGTQGKAVYCGGSAAPALTCCNVYGNAGGDWVGCIAAQVDSFGNLSVEPLFCNLADHDFSLCEDSPCAPDNHPNGIACGLIGSLGVGCPACAPIETEKKTWGSMKARYK